MQAGYSFDLDAEYRIFAGYINFNPYSTQETLIESGKWVKKYKMTPKKLARCLYPYKGTPIFYKLLDDGLLKDGEVEFLNPGIKDIFIQTDTVINALTPPRDIFRFPLKYYREFNVKLCKEDLLEKAKAAVQLYDNMMFEAYDQIVLANGTSPKTVDYFIEKSESFTTHFEEFFELQSLATSYKGVTYYDN